MEPHPETMYLGQNRNLYDSTDRRHDHERGEADADTHDAATELERGMAEPSGGVSDRKEGDEHRNCRGFTLVTASLFMLVAAIAIKLCDGGDENNGDTSIFLF